ncbi:uridine diphosphate glucose pyrophosphatase-like isoform X1 [Argonauta hians]
MDNITNVTVSTFDKSDFIKPIRLYYDQNGVSKYWDFIKTSNSIAVLLFNPKREVLLFVKQFRPVVYLHRSSIQKKRGVESVDTQKYPGSLGITTELCAGILDKDMSAQEIAQAEILEECGYKVPLDSIERIMSYRNGVGTTGSVSTLFYAEITDQMKVAKGGGVAEEGEMIELLEIPACEIKNYIVNDTPPKPGALLLALFWFLEHKYKK